MSSGAERGRSCRDLFSFNDGLSGEDGFDFLALLLEVSVVGESDLCLIDFFVFVNFNGRMSSVS